MEHSHLVMSCSHLEYYRVDGGVDGGVVCFVCAGLMQPKLVHDAETQLGTPTTAVIERNVAHKETSTHVETCETETETNLYMADAEVMAVVVHKDASMTHHPFTLDAQTMFAPKMVDTSCTAYPDYTDQVRTVAGDGD